MHQKTTISSACHTLRSPVLKQFWTDGLRGARRLDLVLSDVILARRHWWPGHHAAVPFFLVQRGEQGAANSKRQSRVWA